MEPTEKLKEQIRALAHKRIDSFINTNKRIDGDMEIVSRIRNLAEYKNAKNVFTFYPTGHEPVITDIFNDPGKNFYFPKIVGNDMLAGTGRLSKGKFDIYEPVVADEKDDFDMLLIPGIAFDPAMNRLGRGLGFFDRFLARIKGKKIGIAYDCQILSNIPYESHDVRMDKIITEARIV